MCYFYVLLNMVSSADWDYCWTLSATEHMTSVQLYPDLMLDIS